MTSFVENLLNSEVYKEAKQAQDMAEQFQTRLYEDILGIPSLGSTFEANGETYRLLEMKVDPITGELNGYGLCVSVADEGDGDNGDNDDVPVIMDSRVVYFPQIKSFSEKSPDEIIVKVMEVMEDFDMDFQQLLESQITDLL